MATLVRLSVLAPDDALRDYGAGALIRLERAASEAGVYAEIATTGVLAATYSYEIFDSTGSSTSWYRYRISNSANTAQSGYEPAFSPGSPAAYATLDDLLLTMGQTVSDTRYLANAERRLLEASRDIDREIGRTFRLTSETRIFHGDGKGVLHVHDGIASLSLVEVRDSTGGTWTALSAVNVGWFLEGAIGSGVTATGEPAFHLQLIDTASYTTFPEVRQGVRLTGTFGWPSIPTTVRAATIAWARQRLGLEASLAGGAIGPDELGGSTTFDRWPEAVRDLIRSERHRFWCHL